MKYPYYAQLDNMDCGPTCLRMICKYYGKSFSQDFLSKKCFTQKTGTSLLGISDAAQILGFETKGAMITIGQLIYNNKFPCIAQWNKLHFIVIYEIHKNTIIVGDPAVGILKYDLEKFCKSWHSTVNLEGEFIGVVLLLKPTNKFYNYSNETNKISAIKYKNILRHIRLQKKLFIGLLSSIIIGSIITLIFPFFTQAIVDVGVNNRNLHFVLIVLLCQLSLCFGSAINSYISSWFTLHISSRINITIVDFFLRKLMMLPISFFNNKMIGDLLQRINDFSRVEKFLTTSVISILISIIGFIIYGYVLFNYGLIFILIFMFGSLLYIIWIVLFLKKRKKIDYMRFQGAAENQSNIIHIINGIQEIKLNNCERIKLNKWRKTQLKLYNINIKGLSLAQMQELGGNLISQTKNILITFIAANHVIDGKISLGMMMAIQYLIGQLNGPLYQVINFIRSAQDTSISVERINEINLNKDEDEINRHKNKTIECNQDICLSNVSFQYHGKRSPKVLNNINLKIRGGKVTAIVGESGSGKTTLIKLILGFYTPSEGKITIGANDLKDLDLREWKKECAVVMQDGYLFSETILQNIGLIDEYPMKEKVVYASKLACIDDFVAKLPLKYNTLIGEDGINLSIGQKQRILIARAIYKNSPYLFLDEATNSLDANNEKKIISNLNKFYKGKTVIIVAHRMSTVINADNIIVLNKGSIVEQGTHKELLFNHGAYYNLVKNQLYL